LVALSYVGEPDSKTVNAAENGVGWLLDLQNRDGGIPTFCRGWGTLPFDQSAAELTVHAMEAWLRWRSHLTESMQKRIGRALNRAQDFLKRSQRVDGAWVPLWFGNESAPNHENPVYGTARTLIGLNHLEKSKFVVSAQMRTRAADFLRATQNANGGWGGDSTAPESIEETAIAVEALNDLRGATRLVELLESQTPAAPIGLYFARLWYYEKLYPLIFATSALGSICSKQF
jgi:squalene-hopene/tetraprenyl-beta-curcumene cyclase